MNNQGRKDEDNEKQKTGMTTNTHTPTFGLPSFGDVQQVTTGMDMRVARSIGACRLASHPMGTGIHQFDGISSLTSSSELVSSRSKEIAPASPLMPSGLPNKSLPSIAIVESQDHYGWTFDDVPTLPEFHKLEQTAVLVPSVVVPEVASRVCDVLRSRSVEATFDNLKAKAKCVTEDGVEFRIRFYRGRDKFCDGLIVEVQRRFGYSASFHEIVFSILDAAEGKPLMSQEFNLKLPDKLIPQMSDEGDDEFETYASKSKTFSGSYSITSDMLKHSRTVDANFFALEALSRLTNPSKIGKATAFSVSRKILSADADDDSLRVILSLLVEKKLYIAGSVNSSISDAVDIRDQRILAMIILCNVVQVAVKFGPPTSLKAQSTVLSEGIIPVLVDEIRSAETNPRMAVFAALCLEALASSGMEMAASGLQNRVLEALHVAREFGRRGNDHLFKATASCMNMLEANCGGQKKIV